MTDDIIDQLAKRVDNLVSEIEAVAKAKHTYTFSHDDHNDGADDYEDVSSTSMSADDDTDDDEDPDDMQKASVNRFLRTHDPANRPGALKHSDHAPNRHKFEALTDKIKNDHGCPRSDAMAIARLQFPDVYRSYQRHTNSEATAKREPSLVEAEMAKGCTREVAMQRVAQLHGFRAFDHPSHLNKRAEDAEDQLIKSATVHWLDNDVDRCSALRLARLDNPRLYRVLTRGMKSLFVALTMRAVLVIGFQSGARWVASSSRPPRSDNTFRRGLSFPPAESGSGGWPRPAAPVSLVTLARCARQDPVPAG
jgi:hypothetical protein